MICLLWSSLLAARQPGVVSHATNGPPGIEQARALRAERAETGGAAAAGEVSVYAAPCDLTVVMAILDVELMLAVAHDQLLVSHRLPRTCSRCRHPLYVHDRVSRARCTMCRGCAGFRLVRVPPDARSWRQLLVEERDAEMIEFRLATARRRVEETLDLVASGYLIMVSCPWCGGVTEAMPGGSFTLRAFTPGSARETYVMCMNLACDPPSDACGYRSAGRPFWPYEELDWLSRQLDAVVDER